MKPSLTRVAKKLIKILRIIFILSCSFFKEQIKDFFFENLNFARNFTKMSPVDELITCLFTTAQCVHSGISVQSD